MANHHCMLALALGREPRMLHRAGRDAVAAKWFVRHRADGVVRRVPSAAEIERVRRAVPGCAINVGVRPGDRLSELRDQDSYSYQLASVHVGAADEEELTRKFERCVAGLPFQIDALGPG